MNRPLFFVIIGGIVVIIATVLNFVLLQEDVQPQSPEQQVATENRAATQAAEQARLDAQKAEEAARKAGEARQEAQRAKAEAEAARQNLARTAVDTAAAAQAASEATEREAAARAAQDKADKARNEADESRLAAERAAKVAQAEAAAARQVARAPDTQRVAPAPSPKPEAAAPAQPASPVVTLPIPEPVAPAAAAPAAPTFDVVRIERDGSAVIAGRAAPGSEVVVRAGRDVIGRAKANGHGEWVLVPDRPLPAGNLEMALGAKSGETEVASDSTVVIVVPERIKPAAASPAAPQSVAAAGPREALAVAVPKTSGGTSRVLQGAPKIEDMRVAVDAVDYDDAGNLTISGYAPKGGRLNVYLDNRFVGNAQADDQGRWSLRPEGTVAPGLYTLRVDLVDPNGTVLARVAFPFSRAEPVPDLKPGDFVIVQPGNSLWRIARRTYGAGLQYHEIYLANRAQIQDPDLIYPGQIFALPKVN